ncbi:hypothetical protein FQN57_005690 [Myotisia sp. PD_48]|nr:hypothetical protein FQN57_005690 [Myotisia sp. PD_48]
MDSRLPNKLPFSKKKLRARVIFSYISDYVILVALIAGFYILDRIEPFHQPFALQNYSLHYPYAVHERVSIPVALAITGGGPIVVIFLYTIVIDGLFSHNKPLNPTTGKRKLTGRYRLKDRLWELNCGVLGLVLAQAAAFVITAALKNAVGKPRPDLIDRCQPGSFNQTEYGLSNYTICTQSNHEILKDGFKSFPSGHSSASFAGLFYLSLYLSGKLHVMDSRGEVWKAVVILIPTLCAALIAATRIMDARHHPFDVITGSLLGVFCAWVAYRQYFPPLSEPWKKGRAHPIRTWGTIPEPPSHGGTRRTLEYEDDEVKLVPRTDEEYQASSGLTQQHSSDQSPPPVNRFGGQPYQRRQPHGMGANYSASSSESDTGFEMQSRYATQRQGTDSTHQSDRRFQQNTTYLGGERRTHSNSPPPPQTSVPVVQPLKNPT